MSNSLDYIRPANEAELYLESLIREDYERCHPGKMLEDIKRRSRFSKEDKGLLRDWMELAGIRAATRAKPQHDRDRTNAIAVAALSRRRRNAHRAGKSGGEAAPVEGVCRNLNTIFCADLPKK